MAISICPDCGARLLHAGLSHACGPHSVEAFLAGRSARGRELYSRFAAMVLDLPGVAAAPAKTRVAFVADVRFASVNAVRDRAIDVHLVLPRMLEDRRFRRIDQHGTLFVHHLRLANDRDFDDRLEGWLQASFAEYGRRGWLSRRGELRRGRRAAGGAERRTSRQDGRR
jgi:hypothetical protein